MVALTMSGVAVAVTAAPAQALPSECGGQQFGPYWFANVGATAGSGSRKVIDVLPTNQTVIWTYNANDASQHWYLKRCYFVVPDVQAYVFRSKADTSKCLGGSTGTGWASGYAVSCSASNVWVFRQISSGSYSGYSAYVFRQWPNDSRCLAVFGDGINNGIAVGTYPCNGKNSQRWY